MKFYLLMYSLLWGSLTLGQSNIQLPEFFSDNMVLQRDSDVNIWGKCKPNSQIIISADWNKSAVAEADNNGNWKTSIKTIEAGGPYNITVSDGAEQLTLKNILLGEVWLCSGQSNMEMPLAGWPPNDLLDNSENEIAGAEYPDIRLFTVARAHSATELDNVVGNWSECSSKSAEVFSATAYFFGKKLHKELGIPIGLIHSSWGGTPAEAWTEVSYLKDVPGYEDFGSNLEKMIAGVAEFNEWLDGHKSIEITDLNSETEFVDIDFMDSDCNSNEFDDTKWAEMELPTKWEETDVGTFDGVLWFRKNITINESWKDKDLIIELGPIDDMDVVYINGYKIGGYEAIGGWNIERKYVIPADQVRVGNNTLAIRVIDTGGGGGFSGNEDQMKIYLSDQIEKSISIAGKWKFLPVAEYVNNKFYLYGIDDNSYSTRPRFANIVNSHSPTMLYNAMIAPLVGYNIKGAIWYQGESNVGRAEQYSKLFPAMIKSWRNAWGQGDFSFYFVQIAPYNYGDPNSSGSAELRESQLSALELPNTGVAVTLDIGMADNIHPANKNDVGERLALWALAKDYAISDIVYSGPIYKSMEVEDGKIILSFDHVGSGLKANNQTLTGFTIAGNDQKFIEASAQIKGNKVIVFNESIKNPTTVRYTWKNVPECSLFNKEGLPAPTFSTE